MKKQVCIIIALVVCILAAVGIKAGVEHSKTPRAVFVNGALYLDTGHESAVPLRSGIMDGKIDSTVERDLLPKQNNQSNFGVNFGYQILSEKEIEVLVEGKWAVFEKE